MTFVWQLLLCRYLHEICLPAVVHHNFNSGNILLDDELNPQLSDCGIADLSSPASVSQVYIYIHTRICIYKDALECYDGVYVCIVVMVVIMGGCAGIAPATTNAGISWV